MVYQLCLKLSSFGIELLYVHGDCFLNVWLSRRMLIMIPCRLNEEMIETLFMVNNLNLATKDNVVRRQILPSVEQENRVLDPKKAQNIAILLRALNVTIDEVCEALTEGNHFICMAIGKYNLFVKDRAIKEK